jgi:hypothetical protein
MKRILLISLLLLAVIFTVSADRRRLLGVRNVAAASCNTVHEQNSSGNSGSYNIGSVDANYYAGQTVWDPAASISVCRLDFNLTKSAGSITGFSYAAQIYTLSGTALNTLLATSDSVTGSDAWSATTVTFSFSSPPALSSGTQYALVVTRNGFDGSNYAVVNQTAAGGMSGSAAIWDSTKVRIDLSNDIKMGIYK